MPRTDLTVNEIVRTSNGLDAETALVAADAVNGMSFTNTNQNVFIYIYNGDVSSKTITITTVTTYDSLAMTDLSVVVAAGERRMVGPFKNSNYGSGTSSNSVYIDFSAATSVTIGAYKLGAL